MNLQEQFFDYIKEEIEKYHPNWSRRITKQWYNCYATINGNDRVIIWVKQRNKDGTFWIFISIFSDKIFKIPDLQITQSVEDSRKFHVSLKNVQMSPIELLDRGLTAKNAWEENWPVGIKVINRNQFSLLKKIILMQWT